MKILIDMNLSPQWIEEFERYGRQAVHWSTIGDPRSSDEVIMAWARENDYIVFTHDLDFGTLLALTHAEGPSVIQVRTQDVMPKHLGARMIKVLDQNESLLKKGALIVLDESKSRVRILHSDATFSYLPSRT